MGNWKIVNSTTSFSENVVVAGTIFISLSHSALEFSIALRPVSSY